MIVVGVSESVSVAEAAVDAEASVAEPELVPVVDPVLDRSVVACTRRNPFGGWMAALPGISTSASGSHS